MKNLLPTTENSGRQLKFHGGCPQDNHFFKLEFEDCSINRPGQYCVATDIMLKSSVLIQVFCSSTGFLHCNSVGM